MREEDAGCRPPWPSSGIATGCREVEDERWLKGREMAISAPWDEIRRAAVSGGGGVPLGR